MKYIIIKNTSPQKIKIDNFELSNISESPSFSITRNVDDAESTSAIIALSAVKKDAEVQDTDSSITFSLKDSIVKDYRFFTDDTNGVELFKLECTSLTVHTMSKVS